MSAHLLDVKQVILKSNCAQLKPLGRKLLRAADPDKARALLERSVFQQA